MMKVLMFGWEFPPYISGGLGTACYGLTKSLSNMEINIDFVLPKVKKNETGFVPPVNILDASTIDSSRDISFDSELDEKIRMIEVDSLLTPYITHKTYREKIEFIKSRYPGHLKKEGGLYDFTGNYGNNLLAEVRRMAEIAEKLALDDSYDLIHGHDWLTFPAALAAKKISGKPLVVHVHATEFDRTGEIVNPEVYEIEQAGMEGADLIIAVSQRTKETITTRYGIAPSKVKVIHNAVMRSEKNNKDYKSALKEKIVLFFGRVTSQKGPFYFIEAAKRVREKYKQARFVMAGSGDLLAKCIKRTAELRMQEYFHFTGFLKGEGIENMFSISDCLVMPSVSEPFGIVPYEAIDFDIPVIVSKQSGIAEVLDHAIKVDFWDTENLANHIIKVLKNSNGYTKKMVRKNKSSLEKVHWDTPARAVANIYKELTA